MHPLHFGRLLRRLREERSLTQEEMAEKLGISRQALFLLETGRGFPSFPLAMKIARLFRSSIDDSEERKEVDMFENRFDPLSELDRLHREVDRLFGETFRPLRFGREGLAGETPAVNVKETDKEVILEAQLPGVTAKDLQINIAEDRIALRGERRNEQEETIKGFVRKEYSFGSFAREITLPTAVKSEEAQASLKNGLLTIRVPKKTTDRPTGHEITIQEE